ncbi:hypothetical protein [Gimesia maris]|uniref:hypothetical protein n=1 Tax=Gimesia maris TaxID=122 RepID=UPI0030DC57E4|tara:strand:+ start:75 stop:689 length:615 start_codon:yes stop_codon:yes gene_type:complete
MQNSFSYASTEPEFVQPDYRKWEAVQIGMSQEEVVALLGPPLDDPYRADANCSYGHLQMPMLPQRRTYVFLIGYDENERVFRKTDPFMGKLSLDGTPSKPEIIIPVSGTAFSHYPRVLDCRWYPSSGEYPITYTIEESCASPLEPEIFYNPVELDTEIPIPFYMFNFGGSQPGRIRVKARNRLGESEWSDYCYFDFSVRNSTLS